MVMYVCVCLCVTMNKKKRRELETGMASNQKPKRYYSTRNTLEGQHKKRERKNVTENE